MIKLFSALILAAATFAVLPAAAGAADYPVCKSRSQDHCMQVPRGAMHDMKSSKETRMKKGMREGKSMMKGEKPSMGHEGSMMESGIPHGCSPATMPCQ